MGLRDRVRKTFKKKDGSSSNSSTPSTSSDPSHYTGRTDIEYYKPNEIPKSKYRGKVDPEHKEKLDSYSFADAFNSVRRKSSQALSGIMSPGGTKSQSRRASYMSHTSKASKDGRAHEPANTVSRRGTVSENRPANIRENSDDDTDVLNAGISKQTTVKQAQPVENPTNIPEVKLERQATVLDQPFTTQELEQAMKRAAIQSSDDSTLRHSMAIAAH
ncbi:hypothetical protein LTR64_006740 [Lithohypha guttulata]|uniref:uncharacterized protein n=1 Tax=Lithohypha guttulata TaxID=1690604 RepID=UPI002DDF080C|nr:hypothetical protein LTR51_004701 [Lithohypha guttulata]